MKLNSLITMYFSGQKSRVSFAVLAYQRPHLLIIDEGSNHLSMDAVDALIEAIRGFKGKNSIVNYLHLVHRQTFYMVINLIFLSFADLDRRSHSSKSRPIFRQQNMQ